DYEVLPVFNHGNPYSASQALNLGIEQAQAPYVVLCHQDVIFYKCWLEILRVRIEEIGHSQWGMLGTAGIRRDGLAAGAVQRLDGGFDWNCRFKVPAMEVQTLDEHCMVLNRASGVRFDEATIDGFHFYGPDICLTALAAGYRNYAIFNPLVHNGKGGSMASGWGEYRRLLEKLAQKWKTTFPLIRMPTGVINHGVASSFLSF
ncbi:MAG: hypothetical protein EOO40_11385, partial [Deltaproteobacteria bacterium]